MIIRSGTRNHTNALVGGKARNLMELEALQIPVPRWLVISWESALELLQKKNHETWSESAWEQKITASVIPPQWLETIQSHFPDAGENARFSVRSSAVDEDGVSHSFAGLFVTRLNVSLAEIPEAIKAVWLSANSLRVQLYRKNAGLSADQSMGVIVQEMLNPDVSGVAFGIDPVSGDREVHVVSSVYGLGEGLVSGELDADTFRVRGKNIESQTAVKTHCLQNRVPTGTEKVPVAENLQRLSSLDSRQLFEISGWLKKLGEHYKKPQDIEFAYAKNKLYLLQTRAVTTTGKNPDGEYILWDNSNIVESYPGITTPLTFSFIIKMYEAVYKQFSALLGVSRKTIERNNAVFAHTLGLVRGRVYYNLLSWYKMLAMVPGYSLNARFMETMMGVKERFELQEDYRMSKGRAWLRIMAMVFRMLWLQWTLPRARRKFKRHLDAVMHRFGEMDFANMTVPELMQAYAEFEQTLLKKWKPPLTNDFFAMIWFGVLQKLTVKYKISANPNIHNDLLCGSSDIVSTEPIHRCMKIASMINADPQTRSVFLEEPETVIWNEIEKGVFAETGEEIKKYVVDFGERCVGELKLETISYSQDPEQFIRILKAYVAQGITLDRADNKVETTLRSQAEAEVKQALKGKLFKKWFFIYALRKARDLVSSRENLRYERTRGFGMVRRIFNAVGKRASAEGWIAAPGDIFYLELEELHALARDPKMKDWKLIIAARKGEFDEYREQLPPSERFYTYGNNFTDEYIYSREKIEVTEGDLQGIGCCPGKIKGKVRIVRDPRETQHLGGDILVTSSTDPGWVTLFMTTSAILVERGSLLSHSAIVSREMGIPCIVSVSGLLRTLKTGDTVEMDGSTGIIKIIEKVERTSA